MEICCAHVKMLVFLFCRRKKTTEKRKRDFCCVSQVQLRETIIYYQAELQKIRLDYINITSQHRAALEESSKVPKSH